MKKKELKPIEMDTKRARRLRKLSKLLKFPIFKQLYKKFAYPDGIETQTGTPIPVNVSLGTYEDQVLHYKVTEYFINKAGTIVLMDCPCRTANQCKNHSIELGCTYLGKGAAEMDLSKIPGGRLATKEEALERERLAYENGLVPHLGKFRGDAKYFGVVEYENELMSICHCCSCCCVVSLAKHLPSEIRRKLAKRLDGLEVRVDPDKCVGCGACFKVCIYDGLKMIRGKTMIQQENCLGCGRCEKACPTGAISITIDDYSGIDELITRFESRVDISG